MNILPEKKQKPDLKEVIYGTLDGKIYFLDLDNGQPTRSPINLGAPIKGSVTVDPRGYPLLYSGQGIDEIDGNRIDIGYRIYNLINQKQMLFINGIDPFAYRGWGAFDCSPLIDGKNNTMLLAGENALFYNVKLNTLYEPEKSSISIKPEIIKYRYSSVKNQRIGTENSPVIYKNYAYYTDNEGILHCLNLNTMTPVWLRDVTDDSDTTIAIDQPDEAEVYLYTANEVDLQENNGTSYVRKINALTAIWFGKKGTNACMILIQTVECLLRL
jgi:outer membrane protein assembly factor BamB